MTLTIQKALIIPAEKEPFKLVHDWPVPRRPGPADVLVKLVSVALNPVDAFVQAHGGPQGLVPGYPYVSGFDGSGVVEEVGAEVTNGAKGDRVLIQGTFNNLHMTFQEYTLQPAKYVAKIPSNITFDQAATVSLCLATVVNGIWGHEDSSNSVRFTPPWEEGGTTAYTGHPRGWDRRRPVRYVHVPAHWHPPAMPLSITILTPHPDSSSSSSSSSRRAPAIQCARMQGFSPLITTASPKNSTLLSSLGARTSSTACSPPPPSAPCSPLPLDSQAHMHPSRYSRIWSRESARRGEAAKRIACVRASYVFPGNMELGVEIFERITGWLETSVIVPSRVEVIHGHGGLAGIAAGCERVLGWHVGAKLVVHVDETP